MELRAVVERDVAVVQCEAPLAEAVAALRGRGHRPLPVCAGGRVVGLLDGRTVAERLTAGDLDVRTARVHDLPLPDLICGWEDEDVTEALALMRTQDLAELLVLDREGGGRRLGRGGRPRRSQDGRGCAGHRVIARRAPRLSAMRDGAGRANPGAFS